MGVVVLVNYKRGSEHITGTAGRLVIVETPDLDLEILATCAWLLEPEKFWPHVEDITWQDFNAPGKPVHVLPNPMRRVIHN
jgi:hypothetical protein